MIGKTIAQYKIFEKLGEGGMGVVYKAEDTKLKRVVALKFLPQHLTSNETEKSRFLQEAQAASALNHANVCTIYDIKDEEGQQFIVMEYVDGVTLRAKVPMQKIGDAVSYAIQIGEALQEAHSKGIIHRDIKADNIMVNSGNNIKVMDFGLAKLKGSMKLTRTSSTVGTLAYMAPEQITGAEVDARSDIFSFGVVLYEMIAGRTPFRGEHEAAMVYSIVNEDQEPIQKYRADLPSELIHILNRALEKDPNDRYQSVGEMVIDLRRVKKESTRVSRIMPVQQPPPSVSQPHPTSEVPSAQGAKSSLSKLWMGVSVLVVVVGAAIFFYFSRMGQQSGAVGSSTTINPNMTLRVLQIPFSQVSYPGISADGNWVTYPAGDRNGKWDVYYMHASIGEPKRITNDSAQFGQQSSDISPDGSQVAYAQTVPGGGNLAIFVASALGGSSRKLVDAAGSVRWRPDGQRLGYIAFYNTGKPHYLFKSVKPDGTDDRLDFFDSVGTSGRYSFAWSPDGRSIVWIRAFKGGYEEIITRDLETGKEVQLTRDKKNIDDCYWLQNGMIIFSSNKSGNTNLWMVPATGGSTQQITKGGGPDIGITASADSKKILYLQQQRVGTVWIAGMDRQGAQQITSDDRAVFDACLSPDRTHLAFIMGEADPLKPSYQVYVQDREGGNRRQVTTDDTRKVRVTWSPDGKWIAYGANHAAEPVDSAKVFLIDALNPGAPRAVGYGIPIRWVNSSSLVIRRGNRLCTELMSVEGGEQHTVFEDSTMAFPVASGRSLFYSDLRTGHRGFWIIPADYRKNPLKLTPKLVMKTADVIQNLATLDDWYYQNRRHEWWKIHFESGKQERVDFSAPGLSTDSPARLSGDGKEMIYVVERYSGKLVMIENLFQ